MDKFSALIRMKTTIILGCAFPVLSVSFLMFRLGMAAKLMKNSQFFEATESWIFCTMILSGVILLGN